MRSVSASEAKQNLAALLDAAQREPVMIRRHERDVAVVLSAQEYERLRAWNVSEFLRFSEGVAEKAAANGMNAAVLEQLLADENSSASGD